MEELGNMDSAISRLRLAGVNIHTRVSTQAVLLEVQYGNSFLMGTVTLKNGEWRFNSWKFNDEASCLKFIDEYVTKWVDAIARIEK